MTNSKRIFHLYGDNIVECERIFNLIKISLSLTKIKRFGNPTNISISCSSNAEDFLIVFFPGFSRWDSDVIEYIKDQGGVLREAPDCIVVEVKSKHEIPLFSIEFCSALPAGNQAWQRSGRAYSSAKAGVPYIFLTEIGGYELESDRTKKAPRMPNPALPFSYLSYSYTKSTPVLPVYKFSPGADDNNKTIYRDVIAEKNLYTFIESVITGNKKIQKQSEDIIAQKGFNLVHLLSENARSHLKTYKPDEWKELFENLKDDTHILDKVTSLRKIQWKKKISKKTNMTESAKKIMLFASKHGQGITSSDLPFCVIPKKNISDFIKSFESIYSNKLSISFKKELNNSNSLGICWINGFKPRGDDSRPDRGLLPFLRMLIGDDSKILTFVYGPAKISAWTVFENNITQLIKTNGLWESVLKLSNFTIADSNTLKHEYLSVSRDTYNHTTSNSSSSGMAINKRHFPTKIGENDVDSLIHLLFSDYLKLITFEGMCNPPGGDWSGISIIEGNKEFRWLTLPRVSASKAKRPDHVIQFPSLNLILSIESKDYLKNLEKNIASDLNRYCKDLILIPPNAARNKTNKNNGWSDDVSSFKHKDYKYASAAAFILSKSTDIDQAKIKSGCDIIMATTFDENTKSSLIIVASTDLGKEIVSYMQKNITSNEFELDITFKA